MKIHTIQAPKGSRSICALAFSASKRFLAAADMSDNHFIHVYDLTQTDKKNLCVRVFCEKSDRNRVL